MIETRVISRTDAAKAFDGGWSNPASEGAVVPLTTYRKILAMVGGQILEESIQSRDTGPATRGLHVANRSAYNGSDRG